ncbi:MAG: MFS transporter, partial [Planctomycetes bacterium]|nr:MFS transporter [Planctomycetota bacterium]
MADTASTARRPRVFFGWYIVAGSVLTNAVLSAAYFQGFSALFLPIERHFGWNRSVISAALSLRQLESGIVSPAVGFLLDRFSPRLILSVSAVLVSAGLIGLGLSNGIVMFFASFVVVSLGASGASHAVTWPVILARWFRRKRGIAMGFAVLGPIFGSPFVIVNTSLEETYGWRAVLVGWGLITLVLISLISAVARERPETYGLLPDGDPAPSREQQPPSATGSRGQDPGLRLHDVLRTRDFWLLMGYLGGMFAVNSAFQVHQIPYFVQDVGLSPQAAAVSLTLVFVISGIGRIGGGYLLDRSDYRFLLAGVAVMMGLAFVYLQLVGVRSVLGALPFVTLF